MKRDLYLGIDIGSVTVKIVLLDAERTILADTYTRVKGDPLRALRDDLRSLAERFPGGRIVACGITGSGGKAAAGPLGALFVNEILAQAAFVGAFHPGARTVIEMGGEDAKLIALEGDRDAVRIRDFSMNAACAAGTGSFLDQQANRLQLTIEEFSSLALRSKNPPPVAGRCSVFAKSDMIHLQQIATPDHDIVAGLCFAMARNFKATVGKGKTIAPPVLFLGGVAANMGMRSAFRAVLGLADGDMTVPDHFATSGAAGAALAVLDRRGEAPSYRGLAGLEAAPPAGRTNDIHAAEPLAAPRGVMPNPEHDAAAEDDGPVDAYIGVDVGSVSTNVVVIDAALRVLSKRYLPTAGRPIEAVKQGLAEVGAEIGRKVTIRGAATTGSGRYLTGDMIGADVVRNEITAQATAAAAIDPSVDTIFEIGGQDSKYISLRGGAVVDFEMNKACAAGTGSFLEEQAERLGIRIKRDFAERALCASGPCKLGERCTVFMESDLVHYLNTGSEVSDLTAGLAYSIAQNYLNKVVAGKKVGEHIFFQGGVAANHAVVSAFERITGRQVTVPPHHEVTGAIGAAILALRERNGKPSAFKGFDLSKRAYQVTTFRCSECSNRCDIRRVVFDGEAPLFYGSRCEKYDVKKKAAKDRLPDLFGERERLLDGAVTSFGPPGAPVVGIPRMLYLNDELPFWRTFFAELGFRVVLSDRTSRRTVNQGLEAAAAETCFPAKAALGHVRDLVEKKVDILFLPSFVRFPAVKGTAAAHSQACPYAQALPYLAKASMSFEGVTVLDSVLRLHDARHAAVSYRAVAKALGKNGRDARRAARLAHKAQECGLHALHERGRQVLSELAPGQQALVLVGRNYNACDPGMNLDLAAKVRDLGVQSIPLDFLPIDDVDKSGLQDMYWRSGQKILSAARFLAGREGLAPLYLTNFGCGPDSFISHFFAKEMAGRPFLQLEIDEHSADAGAVTRIEAFLDSLRNGSGPVREKTFAVRAASGVVRRTVYLPPMTDHAHALAAAFRACGVESEVLPESDGETVRIGKQFSSGRECFPLALTTGDMVKATRRPDFDPDRSAFFMPTGRGPCRFGQYNRFHRMVLDDLGLPQVPIFAPMQEESVYREVGVVGRDFMRRLWQGVVSVDMLQKALWETRPYERKPGEADGIYARSLEAVSRSLEMKRDPRPALRKAYAEFETMERALRDRPVIGVVGEIYIRANRFGNENVVRMIERLGGEAWVAPISEWLLYTNETARAGARRAGSWRDLVQAQIMRFVQERDERKLLASFNGHLRSLHEPSIAKTLERARPYVHHSFEGEAVLSVGKAVDYIKRNVSGIVNVMPFACMPGTISGALLRRVCEDYGNIPLLTIAYEGQQDTQTQTRLEAFLHQARSCLRDGRAARSR